MSSDISELKKKAQGGDAAPNITECSEVLAKQGLRKHPLREFLILKIKLAQTLALRNTLVLMRRGHFLGLS